MAKKIVNQVYGFINDTAKQAFGSEAIKVNDTSGFVALKDFVLSSEENCDAFYGVLFDQTGAFKVGVREYTPRLKRLLRDDMQWGIIRHKIDIERIDANENASWDPNSSANPYDVGQKTKMVHKLFDVLGTYTFEDSVPTYQIFTGCQSAEQMAAVVSGIAVNRANELATAEEDWCNAITATNIASVINEGQETQIIKAKSAYLALHPEITSTDYKTDPEYAKYLCYVIERAIQKMAGRRTEFNTAKLVKHTSGDKLVVELQNDFTSAYKIFMQSSVFHDTMVALPGYEEVEYWQAAKNPQKIAVQNEGLITTSNETGTVEHDNIIGFIHDVDSCGVSFNRKRSWSKYNERKDTVAYGDKADIAGFVDKAENAIVILNE